MWGYSGYAVAYEDDHEDDRDDPRDNYRPGQCYECGSRNHFRNACPEVVVCAACGRRGHVSSNCRTCPQVVTCAACGRRGHVSSNCRAPRGQEIVVREKLTTAYYGNQASCKEPSKQEENDKNFAKVFDTLECLQEQMVQLFTMVQSVADEKHGKGREKTERELTLERDLKKVTTEKNQLENSLQQNQIELGKALVKVKNMEKKKAEDNRARNEQEYDEPKMTKSLRKYLKDRRLFGKEADDFDI